MRGMPEHIRSDNGGFEFAADVVRDWLNKVGAKTSFIEPEVRGRQTAGAGGDVDRNE